MADYIDGFAFPIARKHLDQYQRLATNVAQIWKEHGALAYCEYCGDHMVLAGTASFVDALEASEDEVVIFGWVSFASREARDTANAAITNDPRMQQIMASTDAGFDPSRMLYGGFRPFIQI